MAACVTGTRTKRNRTWSALVAKRGAGRHAGKDVLAETVPSVVEELRSTGPIRLDQVGRVRRDLCVRSGRWQAVRMPMAVPISDRDSGDAGVGAAATLRAIPF